MASKSGGFGSVTRTASKRSPWRARYTGPDAKVYSRSFATKDAASAWLVDERRLIDADQWTSPGLRAELAAKKAAEEAAHRASGMTVGEVVAEFIAFAEHRPHKPLKPRTAGTYRSLWRRRGGLLEGVSLGELDRSVVQRWVIQMGKKHQTATTNGSAYDLLHAAMEYGVDAGYVAENPCRVRGAGKPSNPARERIALTMDQLKIYIAGLPDDYRRTMLMLCGLVGLRSGEVRGLRVCDVDLTAGTVTVRQAVNYIRDDKTTGVRAHWFFDTPKTAAAVRTLVVPSSLLVALKERLLAVQVYGGEQLLFPALTDHARPMGETTLRRTHEKGARAVGVKGFSIHDLRHTCLTLRAQLGATVAELQALAGHTTAVMALRYQHSGDTAREVAQVSALDAALAS